MVHLGRKSTKKKLFVALTLGILSLVHILLAYEDFLSKPAVGYDRKKRVRQASMHLKYLEAAHDDPGRMYSELPVRKEFKLDCLKPSLDTKTAQVLTNHYAKYRGDFWPHFFSA